MTPQLCPNCREQIDPKQDVKGGQREHSAPCLTCNGSHPACQH